MFRPFVAVPLDPSWPSCRQALKRIGMTSAMATFALFSVDDLAWMVGKAMQQRAGDNKVVEQVAKEFQQAGIVLADVPQSCSDCCSHHSDSLNNSLHPWCSCTGNAVTAADFAACDAAKHTQDNNTEYAYDSPNGCYYTYCQPQGLHCPRCLPRRGRQRPDPNRQPHRPHGPLARLLLVSPRLHHRLPHRDHRPLRPPGRVH